jgi:hypothetical protein
LHRVRETLHVSLLSSRSTCVPDDARHIPADHYLVDRLYLALTGWTLLVGPLFSGTYVIQL